ncbi:MAG: NFACT RNA binding domain-containing protein, partial [Longimicrobiales bacterium]
GDLTLRDESMNESGSTVQVAPGTSLRIVRALPDERILSFDLETGAVAGGFVRRIVVELIASRWNAIALGEHDAVTALLQVRERNGAMLRPGSHYDLPTGHDRAGATRPLDLHEFAATVRDAGAGEDLRKVVVRSVAFTSPMNATYIVAPLVRSIDDATIANAHARYVELRNSDAGFVLPDGRGQPYPSALGRTDAVPMDDIVGAFAHVAASAAVIIEAAPGSVDAAVAGVHERIRRLDDKLARLHAEAHDAAAESAQMRRLGDLLFAQLHRIPKGASNADLDDFEGGTVHVALDPALTAKDNALRLHERATRRDGAAERLPWMIERSGAERAMLAELQQRLLSGVADTAEVKRWSAEAGRSVQRPHDETDRLPYRSYRTSSGIELRVGRNRRANDERTFRPSAPNDIWLHARDLAGAHVVMRWTDRTANPPARDLAEAAVIAAVNSKGRTSGMVPVDWTRRKYVRKPRKAKPGSVIVERSKTIFAEPDAGLDRRLREE